ncbi:nuclear RNA export factor 1 [Drosophila obscura]|uniref:nuclear RNA export factor 1 n=1 Tax=Drosophila obscura TaxID=7282 RepID=UPI001BB14BB2|nr:nuclear RNA export factor 1 [Drosophila obscura]
MFPTRGSRCPGPLCHSTPKPERSSGPCRSRGSLAISAYGWYRVLVFSSDHRETMKRVLRRLGRQLRPHYLDPRYGHLGGETDATEDADAFLTFYVNDYTQARELQGLSRQQLGPLRVRVNGRTPWMRLTPAYCQRLRHAVRSRYDPVRQSLDLALFHLAPEWRAEFCALAQPCCLRAVIGIVAQEMPHLLHLRLDMNYLRDLRPFHDVERRFPRLQYLSLGDNRLDSVSELQVFRLLPLIELDLRGNLLPANYERSVRDILPRLQILNGAELHPRPHQRSSSLALHNCRSALVSRLCRETGMNSYWSRGALEVNDWHYSKALWAFAKCHKNRQIPRHAFDSSKITYFN